LHHLKARCRPRRTQLNLPRTPNKATQTIRRRLNARKTPPTGLRPKQNSSFARLDSTGRGVVFSKTFEIGGGHLPRPRRVCWANQRSILQPL
jgi:hypothetical protein